MKTVYADKHVLHAPKVELDGGAVVECSEMAARGDNVHRAIIDRNFGPVIAPKDFGLDPVLRIHNADYVEFLQNAPAEWTAQGYALPAFATNFNIQHSSKRPPQSIIGKMGYYLADTSVSLTATTWEAVLQGAHAALTALEVITSGEDDVAFSLARPPGHHATAGVAAGYSFLNNVAIATQAFLDGGHGKKVAILDVDYHHGNGTQDIFYSRNDVLYASLHADPAMDFPFFLGYADETGAGAGAGFNHNYPLPLGSKWDVYGAALDDALAKIADFAPDIMIVSLGVDTYEHDPISHLKITADDYIVMGEKIAGAKLPTLFVMEGGYAVDDIGMNMTNVLAGFLQTRKGA